MKKTITASVTFVVQDNTFENDFPLELMDPDNFRYCFITSVEAAEQEVRSTIEEALSLSGGEALGHVAIKTEDVE